MPLFSLPSEHFTGTMGKEVYDFIDYISGAGLKWWQLLPLVPPDETGSPYKSCSAFAGSIVYISPNLLDVYCFEKLKAVSPDPGNADYKAAEEVSTQNLKKAFENFRPEKTDDFEFFCTENAYWLEDYAVFESARKLFNGKPWNEWDTAIRSREPKAMQELKDQMSEEISFQKFCQFEFFRQWNMLHRYAHKKNIGLTGDIPIYVSYDSADVWADPSLFLLDSEMMPKLTAGVPPDMFSEEGQLWGNPLYDWNEMEKRDFSWWRKRIKHNSEMYDMLRIDHFIGTVNYYAIPGSEKNAVNGRWLHGPGMSLIRAINESRGDTLIIAEDLGNITEDVKKVLKESGYPGMKLMEFAFDGDPENENLPHNFSGNCIVYGGTHDNETLAGYFSHQKKKALTYAREYLNVRKQTDIPWGIIGSAFRSTAPLAVFQMQDYLGLDNSSRINTPSTVNDNWKYRFDKNEFTNDISDRIKKLVRISGR